jgi:hypothetical protein
MLLLELFIECADALDGMHYDGNERGTHLQLINEALEKNSTPEPARILLRRVAQQFGKYSTTSLDILLVNKPKEIAALSSELREYLGPSRYVYHGTIQGRVSCIADEGLVPGKHNVWSEAFVSRQLLNQAVFFDTSWRGAMSWAQIAHYRSRGARNGFHRTPVVLRLPTSGLEIFTDPLASKSGCAFVRGQVAVGKADIIAGDVRGVPEWQPIANYLMGRRTSSPRAAKPRTTNV